MIKKNDMLNVIQRFKQYDQARGTRPAELRSTDLSNDLKG